MNVCQMAAGIQAFLKSHGIDPDKVTVVVRGKDDYILERIEAAIAQDLTNMQLNPPVDLKTRSLRRGSINGVNFVFSSLDSSRPK